MKAGQYKVGLAERRHSMIRCGLDSSIAVNGDDGTKGIENKDKSVEAFTLGLVATYSHLQPKGPVACFSFRGKASSLN